MRIAEFIAEATMNSARFGTVVDAYVEVGECVGGSSDGRQEIEFNSD